MKLKLQLLLIGLFFSSIVFAQQRALSENYRLDRATTPEVNKRQKVNLKTDAKKTLTPTKTTQRMKPSWKYNSDRKIIHPRRQAKAKQENKFN